MTYNKIEKLNIEISAIGLGGHEYLPNGSSRGFNEDSLSIMESPNLAEEKNALLDKLQSSPTCKDYSEERAAQFLGE